MTAPSATPAPMVLLPFSEEAAEQLVELLAPRLIARLPATESPKALATPELAKALGCSRAKIHKLAADGALPFFWLGDERRFYLQECVDALRARGRATR